MYCHVCLRAKSCVFVRLCLFACMQYLLVCLFSPFSSMCTSVCLFVLNMTTWNCGKLTYCANTRYQ